MTQQKPPPDLAALWKIEGHLRNINHCVSFLSIVVVLWILITIGGSLFRLSEPPGWQPRSPAPAVSNP